MQLLEAVLHGLFTIYCYNTYSSISVAFLVKSVINVSMYFKISLRCWIIPEQIVPEIYEMYIILQLQDQVFEIIQIGLLGVILSSRTFIDGSTWGYYGKIWVYLLPKDHCCH